MSHCVPVLCRGTREELGCDKILTVGRYDVVVRYRLKATPVAAGGAGTGNSSGMGGLALLGSQPKHHFYLIENKYTKNPAFTPSEERDAGIQINEYLQHWDSRFLLTCVCLVQIYDVNKVPVAADSPRRCPTMHTAHAPFYPVGVAPIVL